MIAYHQARAEILCRVPRTKAQAVPVSEALGLVTTQALRARLQMPRYDQSAMDGIAVHVEDLARASQACAICLELAGEMPAGTSRRLKLKRGQAIKVFTGSPIPVGTGAVVMVEYCEFGEADVAVSRKPKPGEHIRRAGEEIRRGDELFAAGTTITPPVVGLLSLFGFQTVKVRPWPRVGVLTMGDELAGPNEPLGSTRIHDSNGPALAAALASMGLPAPVLARVDDNPAKLRRQLKRLIARCEVVITVGGASVGDHDHVASTREQLGLREVFSKVAIKPGKPNLFGLAPSGVPVFSLPGNPVSALVSFHQLVRPGLRAMVGLDPGEIELKAVLGKAVRKKPGRREWLRGTLETRQGQLTATPVQAQGSHMLTGLARADALIEIDEATGSVAAGEPVRVIPLAWVD